MILKVCARSKIAGIELKIYRAGPMQYVVKDQDDLPLAQFPNMMEAGRFCSNKIERAVIAIKQQGKLLAKKPQEFDVTALPLFGDQAKQQELF